MVFVPDDFSQTYVVTHWTSPSTAGQVSTPVPPFSTSRLTETAGPADIRRTGRHPKLHQHHADPSATHIAGHRLFIRRVRHGPRSDGLARRVVLRHGRVWKWVASRQRALVGEERVHAGGRDGFGCGGGVDDGEWNDDVEWNDDDGESNGRGVEYERQCGVEWVEDGLECRRVWVESGQRSGGSGGRRERRVGGGRFGVFGYRVCFLGGFG